MRYILLLLPFILSGAFVFPQDAIINEWSQGHGGTSEWVEILVLKDKLDMRGWEIDDEVPGGVLIKFKDAPEFAAVPSGALIVVYNPNSATGKALGLPDTDTTVLAGCDFTTMFASDNTRLFDATWSQFVAFSNTNQQDNPILKDAFGDVVHDWDNGNTMDNFVGVRPGTQQGVYYIGGDAKGLFDPTKWIVVAHDSPEMTPGQPNGDANTVWITGLRQYDGVQLNPTPIDTTICLGAGTRISVALLNDATYSWTPAAGLSASDVPNPVARPDQSTAYLVKVKTGTGCEYLATIQVNVVKLMMRNLVKRAFNQPGEGAIVVRALSEAPNLIYTLTGQSNTINNSTGVFRNLAPDSYRVTVKVEDTGCVVEAPAPVTVD